MGKAKFVGPPSTSEPLVSAGVEDEASARAEMGRRIQKLLLEKSWSQSDLARAAFGSTTDSRRYNVARNREIVSQAIQGKSKPSPLSLQRMAQALGVKPQDLYPAMEREAIESAPANLEFKVSHNDATKGWLKVNRMVTIDQFAKIMAILKD